ncbi:hypothetical protein [Erwinia tracheiphila]|uniref:hypothetical protein n=1 Tax=Erwinia tracheiphila TaxID=65700 RepID=UPI000A77F29B|nr:hypothetical protein [Erwinia tracheiphila]
MAGVLTACLPLPVSHPGMRIIITPHPPFPRKKAVTLKAGGRIATKKPERGRV